MKKILITIASLSFLISCGGDDDGTPILINEAPGVASLIFPTNNLICTNFNLEFDWSTVTDPEGDTISYIIDIATEADFGTVLFTATTTATERTFTLEKGVTYYWRVKVRDSEGNESAYSETQSFITEPDAGVNTLPYAPTAVTPQNGATLTANTVSLAWDATDADGDTLVYDVYFGDTNPPQLMSENLTTSSFDVSLVTGTQYYWRVVVKDDHEGVTLGQIWSFTTN